MIRGFRCDLKNDSKDKNDVYNILLDEHLQANIDNLTITMALGQVD